MAKYKASNLNGNLIVIGIAVAGCAALAYFLSGAAPAPQTASAASQVTRNFSTLLGHPASAPTAAGARNGNEFTEYVSFGEPAPGTSGNVDSFSFDTAQPSPYSYSEPRPVRPIRERNSDAKAIYRRSFVPSIGNGMHAPNQSGMLPNRSSPLMKKFSR